MNFSLVQKTEMFSEFNLHFLRVNNFLRYCMTTRELVYRDHCEAHLPFLRPLLEVMLQPECNCFFLTLLGARPDGQRYHTDNYFENYCGGPRPSDLVSVAYLEADEAMVGGELVVLKVSADETGPVRHGSEAEGQ
ncbi:unnamed protein product, partial [Symbiodinium necroappetens]